MTRPVYGGITQDHFGGMTPIGTIIRDAWVFGILPQDETCENWTHDQLQVVHDHVQREWDKYGCLVSNLPEELKRRHADIYRSAVENARKLGWDPDLSQEE